jgi:hypothetical protein
MKGGYMLNEYKQTENGYILKVPAEYFTLSDYASKGERISSHTKELEYAVTAANFEKLQALEHEIVKINILSNPSLKAKYGLPPRIARQNRLKKQFPALGYWLRNEKGDRLRFIQLDNKMFTLQ